MINDNEIRFNNTKAHDYFVFGLTVRKQFLELLDLMEELATARNVFLNKNDIEVFTEIKEVLVQHRDYTLDQINKIFKTFVKIEPELNTFAKLAKEMEWEYGANVTASERKPIMDWHRANLRKDKHKEEHEQNNPFNNLFE